ncbi:MAG TPA: helix-turn-helix transcriptional regulator [Actinomycetota bacterium]
MSTSELPSIVDLLPSEIDRAIRLRLATVEGDVFVRFRLDGQSVEAEVLEARPAAEHRPSGTALELRGMAFGTWLQGMLRSEHLSQEAAARRVGVSLKTVNRWVNGRTEPRMRELRRIQEVFGARPPL